jgi:hypothetical protein
MHLGTNQLDELYVQISLKKLYVQIFVNTTKT